MLTVPTSVVLGVRLLDGGPSSDRPQEAMKNDATHGDLWPVGAAEAVTGGALIGALVGAAIGVVIGLREVKRGNKTFVEAARDVAWETAAGGAAGAAAAVVGVVLTAAAAPKLVVIAAAIGVGMAVRWGFRKLRSWWRNRR